MSRAVAALALDGCECRIRYDWEKELTCSSAAAEVLETLPLLWASNGIVVENMGSNLRWSVYSAASSSSYTAPKELPLRSLESSVAGALRKGAIILLHTSQIV